jgi:type I restriction enzyme S subunit
MKRFWEHKKLGEIISLEYGKPLLPDHRKSDGKYPVYGANGIKDRTDKYLFDKPSIIIGRKGSAGEINLTDEKFWPLDVTYFVVYDQKKYDRKFLFYLLSNLQLQKLAKGVKPGINRNDVYSIEAEFPPLPEQQRIVEILDQSFAEIDQAIENTEKNYVGVSKLFQSSLDRYFQNPGNDWEICNLEDYIKFIDYRGHTPQKLSQGMRLITAKNVKNGYLQIEPKEFVDPKIYDTWMVRGIPRKGDVLFTTEAPLANIAQLNTDEKVLFAQRIIILQPDIKKMKQTYLKYLLLSTPIRQRIFSKSTGATVQGIKAKWLKKVEIYFPKDLEKQDILISKFDSLWENKQELEKFYSQKINLLQELKQSILHKAFTGELT